MQRLGIDIGGTSIKLAAIHHNTTLWTARSTPYHRPDAQTLINALAHAAPNKPMHFHAVGLCVPGILDPSRQRVTFSVNVPGLMKMPLTDLLHAALGNSLGPIHIVTDTRATAHDLWFTRRPVGRLLVLCLGTGVGAAVLDDDVPLHVSGETPGHFGQLDVSLDDNPPLGPDGGAGSLEAYLGAAALGHDPASTIQRWQGHEPPLRALARAIRIAHALYRPHHVILAGGIGIRLARLLPTLRQRIDTHLTNLARPDWSLSTADHDFHAALGAARLATSP